jgi:flagellar assembly factor FliW
MTAIHTTRFGDVEVKADQIVEFKDGVIGFSKLKKYVLVESPSMPLVLWLQSMERPDVAFPLIEPWFFKKDYKVVMSDADKITLGLEDAHRTKVFVIMTIPEEAERMTINLKAPLVMNIEESLGAQVIQQDRGLEVRVPAHEAFSQAMSNLKMIQSTDEGWVAVDLKSEELTEHEAGV